MNHMGYNPHKRLGWSQTPEKSPLVPLPADLGWVQHSHPQQQQQQRVWVPPTLQHQLHRKRKNYTENKGQI